MECLVKNTNKSLISNRLPAGTIFYWAGKKDTIPEWALFCNGDSFPIPTSEEDEMWDLYQVIGTIYNKAAGSGYNDATPAGYFSIPDFVRIVEDSQEKQVGLFIRSATNDDQVGVKQNDAIRNIRGDINYNPNYGLFVAEGLSGPFILGKECSRTFRESDYRAYGAVFNAAEVVPTSTENRPYSIYALPLISY